jgi:hypothetical protein
VLCLSWKVVGGDHNLLCLRSKIVDGGV